MPMITASTGASLRLGASRAELPWQKSTISPMPAPTLSTATIVFMPPRNLVGSLSSTSCGRKRRSLRPFMDGSFFVATTEPSTRARNILVKQLSCLICRHTSRITHHASRITLNASRLRRRFLGQNGFHVCVRTGDDVNAGELAFHGFDGLSAGVGRGFDGGDVADDHRGDQRVADLGHRADEFNVCRFEHGIGALDKGDQSAGFKKSNGL